jgi:Flp pilus assembly protein protease CpaA
MYVIITGISSRDFSNVVVVVVFIIVVVFSVASEMYS